MARVPQKPKKESLSVRFLFIIGGVVWGLALGPDIGLTVAKFVGGLNWPLIAGTREWPEWADWVVAISGIVTGLASFFAAFTIGRNVGDRFEYSHDVRLSSGGAIPWAVIAIGVAVGSVTVQTVDVRKQAVVDYVQEEKNALIRLDEFAGRIQRFKSVRVEWPGNGKASEVAISFRGKHYGAYLMAWEIRGASNNTKPVMTGEIGLVLSPGERNTDLALAPRALIDGWRKLNGYASDAKVSEDFTFTIRLIPEPTSAEWKNLPRREPGNLADGQSILIDEMSDSFPVSFELRNGRSIWFPR